MSLQNKIKNRFGKKDEIRLDTEDGLIMAHHMFMKAYSCWISPQEFLEMPIPTFLSLMNCMRKEHEAQEREMKKARKK